jgi:hypothetical protein
MGISHMFARPILIYDDKCSSCTKFAKTANTLSRGWIHIAGHYYSHEGKEAKKIVFPAEYDATKMFWLINKSGAYGARRGLIPVIREIIIGLFRGKGTSQLKFDWNNNINNPAACGYRDQTMTCESAENILKRIANMMRNSGKFQFED